MCQLPDAGMKFPNSIGGGSGLDSQYCPPRKQLTTTAKGCIVTFLTQRGNDMKRGKL
jgi:hypothetical protein